MNNKKAKIFLIISLTIFMLSVIIVNYCEASVPKNSLKKSCQIKLQTQKKTVTKVTVFFQRCVPQAERDVPFGRDVCFASDVRFARENAEHITSL